MTRSDYPKLLEVLSIPHTADDIKRLPEKLTLQEKCHRELPLRENSIQKMASYPHPPRESLLSARGIFSFPALLISCASASLALHLLLSLCIRFCRYAFASRRALPLPYLRLSAVPPPLCRAFACVRLYRAFACVRLSRRAFAVTALATYYISESSSGTVVLES
jgi:hypothetical protein